MRTVRECICPKQLRSFEIEVTAPTGVALAGNNAFVTGESFRSHKTIFSYEREDSVPQRKGSVKQFFVG